MKKYAITNNNKIIKFLDANSKKEARAAFAAYLAFQSNGGNFKLIKIIDEV